ncbi:MAG: M24 family metallopeptidase [Acidimicrobiales bacterium]
MESPDHGAALAAIPGLSDAGRVGVDALSPGFAKAVSTIAPKAEVVAADLLMHSVRRTKSPAEQAAIAVAVDVVARGLDAVERAVGPGAVERQLAGVAVEAMARAGATVPASAPTVRIASPGRAGAGVLAEGDVVVIDLGVLLDGWEGGVGRTVVVGAPTAPQQALGARAQGRLAALVDVCRTGATGLDFQAAAGDATTWMVRGVGMGFEPPVITADLGADAALEAAMVLSVEVDCNEASVGTWRVRDLVAVSDRGPERLGTGP